jgi:hypothetical protein
MKGSAEAVTKYSENVKCLASKYLKKTTSRSKLSVSEN